MYLTYDEYSSYGGKLSNADFDRFRFRSECEIDNATFNRCKTLSQVPESVKRCVFELVAYFSKNAKNGSVKGINSTSNDGYSVSYTEINPETEIENIIRTYLLNTGLMYCGVD